MKIRKRQDNLLTARMFCILIFMLYSSVVSAYKQDTLLLTADTLTAYVEPLHLDIPTAFQEMGPNIINGAEHGLYAVFERLSAVRTLRAKDTVRIVHIGDSHIRGHVYPRTTGRLLTDTFGSVAYTDIGINGATCHSFAASNKMRKLFEIQPDMVIISFGTNESYGRYYVADNHYAQIDELITKIRENLPHAVLLLTTPPGSYFRFRSSRRVRVATGRRRHPYRMRRIYRTLYTINPNNDDAVSTICRYASDHALPLWNLYAVAGGTRRACCNWTDASLMRPDHVHFVPECYRLQGQLLFNAILKAYNEYISR